MPASPQPASGPQLRISAAAMAVALISLWASLDSYNISRRLSAENPDIYGAAKAHLRFAPALPLLPANDRVTYLSNLPLGSEAGTAAFLTAQNALAPRILVQPTKTPQTLYAIGQFSQALDFAGFGRTHGYELVRDLGNGVILYRML